MLMTREVGIRLDESDPRGFGETPHGGQASKPN